jgi:hypothetical protein
LPPPGGPGNPPSISGINEIEVDVFDMAPDFGLNAAQIEIPNPTGDGIRCWLDLGLALDIALRLSVCVARLRRTIP